MRTLSNTLVAAQKQASHIPCVKLEAVNKTAGVTRLDWQRLYSGIEEDYFHTLTIAGDGSLIRARITTPSDSRKLYVQRTANPSAESDFGNWTYTNQYNAVVVTAVSFGATVYIFWIKSDRKIQLITSINYGSSWSAVQLIDYAPSTAINGISAACKTNGDIALFFADQSTLYVKKLVNGQWQPKSAWNKSTGGLSGMSAFYDNDWLLFITGKDSGGNYKLWSLVYGDEGNLPAGNWGELKTFAEAPSDDNYSYRHTFLDKPDVFRCGYIEKFEGNEAYSRPFFSYTIDSTAFANNLWYEPQPFDLSSEYGLAAAHYNDCCWLSSANGVWRASLAVQSLELDDEIISLKNETDGAASKLTVELINDNAKFASLTAPLAIGCRLNFSPGYKTSHGNELSSGQSFSLDTYEYINSDGVSKLVLYASNRWRDIERWVSKQQFRWNGNSDDMNIKEILAFILARAGLRLEVISESATANDFYPDFCINPGMKGNDVIRKLLSFMPDLLFIEGDKAYLINPSADDASIYSYSASSDNPTAHSISKGRYLTKIPDYNYIKNKVFDNKSGQHFITSCYDWEDIKNSSARIETLDDSNISTVSLGQDRGNAIMRKYHMKSAVDYICVPVNCGQQVYDVIDITDKHAGLTAIKRRVIGISLFYNTGKGLYEQVLMLTLL